MSGIEFHNRQLGHVCLDIRFMRLEALLPIAQQQRGRSAIFANARAHRNLRVGYFQRAGDTLGIMQLGIPQEVVSQPDIWDAREVSGKKITWAGGD